MDTEELGRRLKEAALLEGEFTLRSGRKSHYYFDKYRFETCPDLLRDVAAELAAMLPEDADRLAGAELGGVPLATAVALETGKGELSRGLAMGMILLLIALVVTMVIVGLTRERGDEP